MNYYPEDLLYTRMLYWILFLLFVAALLMASGALTSFEDGSFILRLGGLDLSGCVKPLAVCAR